MRTLTIWDVRDLVKSAQTCSAGVKLAGVTYYVPARPFGIFSIQNRLRAAWLVFTGRADAVTWPQQ